MESEPTNGSQWNCHCKRLVADDLSPVIIKVDNVVVVQVFH